MFVFHLRPARKKARPAAVAEALGLLRDLTPTAPVSGPLAEQGGVFWIEVPEAAQEEAIRRLPHLGYTVAVDLMEEAHGVRKTQRNQLVPWRKREYWALRMYTEDAEAARAAAPDRRTFWLTGPEGARPVTGYRGDGGPLSRRGLPVCDARLLVNLVTPAHGGAVDFLEPFAGVGGVVLAAAARGWRVFSLDLDPALRVGLATLGARHCVADAAAPPLPAARLVAIAGEPPYEPEALTRVAAAVTACARLLRPGGRLALLAASAQVEQLSAAAAAGGLRAWLACPVDRKGTPCTVLAWEKDA